MNSTTESNYYKSGRNYQITIIVTVTFIDVSSHMFAMTLSSRKNIETSIKGSVQVGLRPASFYKW